MSIFGQTKCTELEKQITQLAAGEAVGAQCIMHLLKLQKNNSD